MGCGSSVSAHLAAHFALQATHDGGLALDDFTHALVLAGAGLAPCPVADGFLLDGGVDNLLAEFFLGDEFHRNCCFEVAGQEFFFALFDNEFMKLDRGGGVAGPAVFKLA